MKLPFLDSSLSSWPWPSCQQRPRTLSFRNSHQVMFKPINSAYLDSPGESTPETAATSSYHSPMAEELELNEPESVDNMIKGLMKSSGRLFFDVKGETSSILEEKSKDEKQEDGFVLLTMESRDPFRDFRKSMDEMVEAHGMKDWKNLEELLYCYLKVNGNSNHGYILSAFIDLLLAFSDENGSSGQSTTTGSASTAKFPSKAMSSITTTSNSSCSCSYPHDSPSSPLSFYTSCSSSEEEILMDDNRGPCLSTLLETEDSINDVEGNI